MDDGHGRDIAPDEDRLNYTPPLAREDVEEDGFINASEHHGFTARGNFHISHHSEPMDATTDAVGSIERRVFNSPRHRGTSTPDFYKSEENRLTTFRDWPHQRVIAKEALGRNGFVFTGTGDKVRCIFCNGILRQWEHGDVVEEEHRRNYPECPFLLGENVGNIPFHPTNGHHHSSNNYTPRQMQQDDRRQGHDIDPIEDRCGGHQSPSVYTNGVHVSDAVSGANNSTGDDRCGRRVYSTSPRHPRMAVEPNRLETFGTWPAQMQQKPKQLAQAGLFYTGDGDKVKCFHCDVLLYGWEPQDDPFVEHARWFPDCEYIRLVKGEDFVRDVKSGRLTHDSLMETPAVLAVLYEGHSVENVKQALDAMRAKNGPDTVITAEKLLNTVLEIEDTDKGSVSSVNGTAEPEDVQRLRNQYEDLREKQQCKICMDNDIEVIFYPCKHIVCCASCGASVRECPICRVRVESMDKVYMS